MANKNLGAAKKNKNDEFYTMITDIEKELRHYKDQLRDKVILCNCDDPEESNFWKYFLLNFNHLGLKKLISTHYDTDKPSYKLEYDGKKVIETILLQNGDFRSPECIELLKESDIIITNPPFSLFREYIAQLIEHDKKFLLIGNMNAITYKEIFKLIKDNKLWLGYNNNQSFVFKSPYENTLPDNIKFCENKGYEGKNYIKVPAINWFTNLDISKRHEDLILYKEYNEKDYPKYDNYDAIEVNRVKDIPYDYYGPMGVPITFLDKHNPDQFDIIWQASGNTRASAPEDILLELNYQKHREDRGGCSVINNKRMYSRILIKRVVKE